MIQASATLPTADDSPPGIDWGVELARHGRWLRTLVYARVGESQAVDEVLQEVSLAALAQRAPLADPEKIAPWLYRLAVIHSLRYRRSRARERGLSARYATAPRPESSATSDPLGWLLHEERRQQVRDALARLPPRDAEILLLKYTERWSSRELAARLGLTEHAIDNRLHRARERLRQELFRFETEGSQP